MKDGEKKERYTRLDILAVSLGAHVALVRRLIRPKYRLFWSLYYNHDIVKSQRLHAGCLLAVLLYLRYCRGIARAVSAFLASMLQPKKLLLDIPSKQQTSRDFHAPFESLYFDVKTWSFLVTWHIPFALSARAVGVERCRMAYV